jgi:two-component system, NarL family, response regulator DevR
MLATKTAPIRILLVDDHEVVRVGLRSVLDRVPEIKVVGEAASMAEAIAQTSRHRPQVVVMDVRLSDGNGVEACREIIAVYPQTRVLFLTSYADDESILAAVAAGAHGYLLKEIGSRGLVQAIQTVASGRSILDPAVTARALEWIKNRDTPSSSEKLSPQEERVLALVAEGKTNREIADALGLREKTIKNYLANIFDKLHITRRSQAAAYFVRQTRS